MRRPSLILLAGVAGATYVAFRFHRQRAIPGLVREYFDAWESGDPNRFERIVSSDYKGHVNALAGTEGFTTSTLYDVDILITGAKSVSSWNGILGRKAGAALTGNAIA